MPAVIDLKQLQDPLYYIPHYLKVLAKSDAHGKTALVPMKLWPAQEYYIKNRGHRNICLKNRQQGFTSGVLADNATALFTTKFQRQTIVANDDETATWIFQTMQRFHRNLPVELRPQTDWKSGKRMRFPNLDSFIYVDSAQSDSLGIGHTLNVAHLSEMARWPARTANQLYADISQTVPVGGLITIESTPRGRGGKFYELCQAAKQGDIDYKYFFFPWWWDVTCVLPVENDFTLTAEEQSLVRYVKQRDNMDMTKEQILFRRWKIGELGDLFYQEYPENDVDCWLLNAAGVFDGIAIRRYLKDCWAGRKDNNLTIWKDSIGGERYVIGVDVAAGKAGGDFSVASVINIKRNEYVARLKGRIPPDVFAQEVLRLGARYNDAMIGVERTGHGHMVIKILIDNNYPNMFHYLDYDSIKMGSMTEPGWITSPKSKPIMIASLDAALRAQDLAIWSEDLLNECSDMYYDGMKTKTSGFDDEAMAVMIALQLRESAPIIDANRSRVVTYARL